MMKAIQSLIKLLPKSQAMNQHYKFYHSSIKKLKNVNILLFDLLSTLSIDVLTVSFLFQIVDKICTIYQNAVESDGSNEEALTQLFMSYARINDYAAQQQISMQLYKLKQKTPYYCWAVMSCLLKAIHGVDKDDAAKRKISLELAQRMMERLINENKLDGEQHAQLYLIILDKQDKHAEQLDFLNKTIGAKMYPSAPIELRVKLIKNLNKWPELNVLLKGLLREQYVSVGLKTKNVQWQEFSIFTY